MSMLDFDAFLDAQQVRPREIRLLGQTWQLPADPPAQAVLEAISYRQFVADLRSRDPDDTVSDDEKRRIILRHSSFDPRATLEGIVGVELVGKWLANGLTWQGLQTVLWHVVNLYEAGPDGGRPGEAEAPDEGAPAPPGATSSPSGDSSKPTSPATTGST